ncbi:MAG TPA: ATP-dependent zinc metalloprotease FtsH [Asticcacaulis sp.]|nr:ATP-dependent zinc metalloprotease FtsH [Asticcacaulis sp.]
MNLRSVAIIGVVLALLIGLYTYVAHINNKGVSPLTGVQPVELVYSELTAAVKNGQVKEITFHNDEATGKLVDNRPYKANVPWPDHVALDNALDARGIKVTYQNNRSSILMSVITTLLPVVLIIGIWIFFMRQMQGGGRGAMGFGKSKARLLTEHKNRVTFNDVAGVDEAKEELTEVVDFLKDPSKFQKLGGKIPKGALLVGPPGTGKTLLARAVAGEAGVPFFSISGSDFVEMFVGVGASRVRDMFDQAKKNAPCIIFIDEIDAVGRHRGAGHGGGNDEREQTLNQLLVEMDGFEANEGIIMIAATNRPDVLDSALLRPGRFDRQVVVPNPDLTGREAILRVHMKNVPMAVDVNVKVIARGTPGFSGADLANLVNEAALMAARKDRKLVTMRDFEDAKDKVLMGAERKSMAMSEQEKKLTAYHEGGHAIVALKVPEADPVHKATIIPRGRALGMVMQLPEGDRYSQNFVQMTSRLAIMMAGRVAEELIFGKDQITSGASSDIQAATRLAKAMVTRWGFSDKLGFVNYKESEDEYGAFGRDTSEATAQTIDAEVMRLINEGYDVAKRVLVENLEGLHRLAKTLLDLETLTGDEIAKVLNGEEIKRDAETGVAVELSTNLAVPETDAPVAAQ